MSIVITPNETNLIEAFSKKGLTFQTKNLLVGDIHICKGEEIIYIIERKAKGDLLASIKDGRYHEQKSRLLETGLPTNKIIYLMENLTRDKIVWGAICNTQYRDGCAVFQTKNIDETVEYLSFLAKSVDKFYQSGDISVNVDIKKKNCTSEEWLLHSLTLIPRVSVAIAKVILENYPTLTHFKEVVDTHDELFVAELKHGNSKRRIGEKLSREIFTFLQKAFDKN